MRFTDLHLSEFTFIGNSIPTHNDKIAKKL